MHENRTNINTEAELFNLLTNDERIILQSEEIWESFTDEEKSFLLKIISWQKVTTDEKTKAVYLYNTGVIDEENQIFSPIIIDFIEKLTPKNNSSQDFSKKEHQLFSFLKDNLNRICSREEIVEAVWPEEEAIGVSDWAIDRLVARLRNKLKFSKDRFGIITIKTRGFKLVSNLTPL